MDRLLTASEVSERLSISTRKLRELVAAGDIAFIAIGNGAKRQCMRFEASEVDDFIRRQRRQMHPPVKRHARISRARQSAGSVDFLAILEERKEERRKMREKEKSRGR